MQKISVNAGLSCPNRDGSKGRGGCTYCNNDGFVPAYCHPHDAVAVQLEKGIDFFRDKYPTQQYLAYFQSYSNTYAPVEQLEKLYYEALAHTGVKGLIISTRPDCLPPPVLELLADIARKHYLKVEIGVESTCNRTLQRINRCHKWEDSVNAIQALSEKKIPVGAHLILGLPGESRNEMMEHASKLNCLPLQSLKLHQLQITRHTDMARAYAKRKKDFDLFTLENYIETVIDFTERLRPDIMIERFGSETPPDLLLAPQWGLKNFELVSRVEKRMAARNAWQGRRFQAL